MQPIPSRCVLKQAGVQVNSEIILGARRDFSQTRTLATVTVFILLCLAATSSFAQQGGATGQPLVINATSLPRAYLHQPYQDKLHAQGGILPLRWTITDGAFPPGLTLNPDGTISGSASAAGEFKFTATVRDSGRPAYERKQEFTIIVVAPLMAVWGQYPKVDGQKIEGSVKVSNQTEQDFDLTVIVLAVNPIGRATAIGYQHFPLKKGTTDFAIPFGNNLPPDPYEIDVDVVGEVGATYSIYRARLVTDKKVQIVQGP